MTHPVVEVDDVSLVYRLAHNRAGSFKEYTIGLLKRQVTYEQLAAVNGVSFTLDSGQVLGIVGHNGAGKSTLMKMVARVLPPTSGRVVVRGSVAPMIELGAGFNEELTGAENVVLYGAFLGRDPDEMRERVTDIASWSELTSFMDVPVRSYSTGMLARLAFAVATDTAPNLLIIDEVMSVGDESFQRKSRQRIHEMIDGGAAVLLVSHNLELIRESADTVLWLDHGHVKAHGNTDEVVDAYVAAL